MPLEFACPHCSALLGTPDASAGKMVRCPHCENLVRVPLPEQARPVQADPVEDETETSSELAKPIPSDPHPSIPRQTTEETGVVLAAAETGDTVNPYAAPLVEKSAVNPEAHSDDADREGLPWEVGDKSPQTFWKSATLILGSPSTSFQKVWRRGGFANPLLFAIAGSLMGGLLTAIYGSLFQALAVFLLPHLPPEFVEQVELSGATDSLVVQVASQFGMAVVLGTVGVVVKLFVGGVIYHFCLMMFRGANQPFVTTVTVVGYVTGATALIQVVPICGQYVHGLVALLYIIIGLAAVHETTTGKAVAAVLVPTIVCTTATAVVVAGILFYTFSNAPMF